MSSEKRHPLEKSSVGLEIGLLAVAGLAGVPFLEPALSRLVDPLVAEQARRQSKALKAAEQLSGLSREQLADRISANPKSIQILTRFLFAAGQNGHDEILEMIGRSLVRNLEALEADKADQLLEEEMILLALQDLTPLHVSVMLAIREIAQPPAGREELGAHLARETAVITVADLSPRIARFLFASLEASGLVAHPNVFGDDEDSNFYGLSELGELVLSAAAQVQARS
jgi:hypothetical protein